MKNVNVWRLFTHHIDRSSGLAWMSKNERIAIGWGRIGDVNKFASQNDIKAAIKRSYPVPEFNNNAHLGAPSLWDLCHEMEKDDLVILSGGTPRTLVVQVVGAYEYTQNPPIIARTTEGEYQNQRAIVSTAYDPEKIWAVAGGAPGKSRYQTLIRCAHPIDLDE